MFHGDLSPGEDFMARPRDHQKHISAAVEGLLRAVTVLVESVAATMRDGGGDGGSGHVGSGKASRGPGKGNPRLRSALKNYWAKMTPKQRAARVKRMLAGRGLKPKRNGRAKHPHTRGP
jgi:hypothetical protein